MKINKQIKDLINRIEKLERVVFAQPIRQLPNTKIKTAGGGLPDRILELRKAGFFKQQKTSQEVHTKLQSTYPCDLNRVEVTLLRLLKRKFLRITSKSINGKKLRAYVW